MENVIYKSIIAPASESPDGGYPTILKVTQEVNCFMVWLDSYEQGVEFIHWFNTWQRDEAIEFGVAAAISRKRMLKEAKLAAENNGYPPDWPKCPACGRPALDGHITCGQAECNEGLHRQIAPEGIPPGTV